jgi:hypothetical protein
MWKTSVLGILLSERCLRKNRTRCASYFRMVRGIHDADLRDRLHSDYRALLTGALPAQAHANRPELCEPPVKLKVYNRCVSIVVCWTVFLSSVAAISSGLWRDARVQEIIHGQLAAPPSSRCIRGPHHMHRSEPESLVSHWRRK